MQSFLVQEPYKNFRNEQIEGYVAYFYQGKNDPPYAWLVSYSVLMMPGTADITKDAPCMP